MLAKIEKNAVFNSFFFPKFKMDMDWISDMDCLEGATSFPWKLKQTASLISLTDLR